MNVVTHIVIEQLESLSLSHAHVHVVYMCVVDVLSQEAVVEPCVI